MIDTEQVILCLACHKPLQQKHGKRARLYCNDICKTTYHRRKAREEEQAALLDGYLPETQQVLADVQVHSMELAQRVANAINAERSAGGQGPAQEKLAACASRIEKLERQVQTQRERLGQYYQSSGAQSARIAELEQELARYREVHDRTRLEAKFMALGELLQYRALLMIGIMGSLSYWQSFMERADDEQLTRAVASAEAFYENLTAPRLEQQQKRIAELEEQVRKLQERLNVEARYLVDIEPRHFKA